MKFTKLPPFSLLAILFLSLFFGLFKSGYAQLSLPVPITWQNLVDVVPLGNTITKTTPNGWGAGASGASSTQYIPTGYQGYVEFSMTNNAGMAGLSNGDPDADYLSLDYAIQAGPNYGNTVVIYENGIQKATSSLLYNSSDRYRVALEFGSVKYYHSGTLIYTSSTPPTYPLLFDTALYANGGQIKNAFISSSPVASPPVGSRPPKISNVKVTNITQTGARVTWDTDATGDSQVEYCITASRCGISSLLNVGLVTNHLIDLSGLIPNTYYFIWIKSDGAGGAGVLGYYLFRTASGVTLTPTPVNLPMISNIQVTNITRDSARVTWETDKPADSSVFGCFARVFCFKILAQQSNFTTTHFLNISGLKPDTNQNINIGSKDANGQTSFSNFYFKTQPGLVISNIKASITRTSVAVTWDTNYSSNSELRACRFPFFCLGARVFDPALSSLHSMTVTNLKPGIRYYYQLTSVDGAGYMARTSNVYITTLP